MGALFPSYQIKNPSSDKDHLVAYLERKYAHFAKLKAEGIANNRSFSHVEVELIPLSFFQHHLK